MKTTIFYFDDEVICLNLFQEMFGGEYDVRTATTLSEAWRMLAERPAEIVISDQSMSEITGVDFLQEVAAKYPSSFRVLLTGSISIVGVFPLISAGTIHLFIPKPWTEHGVRQLLERSILYL
jgi:DNA-binding NtrC family response regulator